MVVVRLRKSEIEAGRRVAAGRNRSAVRCLPEFEDLIPIKRLEKEISWLMPYRDFGGNAQRIVDLGRILAKLSNAYAQRHGQSANTRRLR